MAKDPAIPQTTVCFVIDSDDEWTDTESLEENKTNGEVPIEEPNFNGNLTDDDATKTQDSTLNGNNPTSNLPTSLQDEERQCLQDPAADDFEFDFQTIDEAEQTEHILKVRVHANFCMRCGAGFVQQKKLNIHLEKNECSANKNSIEMPLTCSICGQGFFGKNCLRHHLMLHAQTKPFKCKKCRKSFVTVRNLYSHYQTHKGYRPFICDLCPKAFHSAKKLSQHHKDHAGKNPYSCKHCSKRFDQSIQLARHKQKHATKKPFKCKFCPRSYAQNSVRNLHMRSHTRTKSELFRFLCELCGIMHVRPRSVRSRPIRRPSHQSVILLSDSISNSSRDTTPTTRRLSSSKSLRRMSSTSGSSVEIVEDPLQFTIWVDD